MIFRYFSLTAAVATALAFSTGASAQLKSPRDAGTAPAKTAAPAPAAKASAPAPAATDEFAAKIDVAQRGALGWLFLLDRKDWGTSWESSSAFFRSQVPLAAWMDGIPKTREPLGDLVEREPVNAGYRTTLPGRPAGEYVTVVFSSKFTKEEQVEELVTMVREADGKWRVIGYSTR